MAGSDYRNPNPKSRKPHTLISKTSGINRFVRGEYVCSCGEKFTGITRFEEHRAKSRRNDATTIDK